MEILNIHLEKQRKIGRNSKHDWYQRGLASMVYKFYDNNSRDTVTSATHTRTVIPSDRVSKDQQLIRIIQANH